MEEPLKLGTLLLRTGKITREQLDTALREQKRWGGKLGDILVSRYFIKEEEMVTALAQVLNLPRVENLEELSVPEEVLEKLTHEFASLHDVVPVWMKDGKTLTVAMVDPTDIKLVDEMNFLTGCRIQAAVAGSRVVKRAIRRLYLGTGVEPMPEAVEEGGEMKLVDMHGKTMMTKLDDMEDVPAEEEDSAVRGLISMDDKGEEERGGRKDAEMQRRGDADSGAVGAAGNGAAATGAAATGTAATGAAATGTAATEGTDTRMDDALKAALQRFEAGQQKSYKAIKALVTLMVEKGYFTLKEYKDKLDRM